MCGEEGEKEGGAGWNVDLYGGRVREGAGMGGRAGGGRGRGRKRERIKGGVREGETEEVT